MAGRQVQVEFTGDASPFVAATNQVIANTKTATTFIRDFGKGAYDAESLIRGLANSGNQELAQMAQVLVAAGVPVHEITQALTDANRQIAASAQDARQKLLDSERAAKQAEQSFTDLYHAVGAVRELTTPLLNLARTVVEDADSFEHLNNQVRVTATSAQQAQETIATVEQVFHDLDGAIPYDSLLKGAAALQMWHQPVSMLSDVAVLAARAQIPVEELAEAIGKGGEGSVRALRQIGEATGVTKEQLELMTGSSKGSAMSLDDLAKNGDKVKEIFHKLADEARAHGNATTDLERAHNKLNAELEKAKSELGEALLPTIVEVTKGVRDLVTSFNSLPGWVKAVAAESIAAGAGVAILGNAVGSVLTGINAFKTVAGGLSGALPGIGTGSINAAAGIANLEASIARAMASTTTLSGALPTLAGATTAIKGGATAAAAGIRSIGTSIATAVAAAPNLLAIGGIVLALASIWHTATKAADDYVYAQQQTQQAMEETTQRAQALAHAMSGDWAHKSAQQLHDMGVTTRDVSQAIIGLNDKIEETNARSDIDAQKKAEIIDLLQQQKTALEQAGKALGDYDQRVAGTSHTVLTLTQNLELAKAQYEAGQSSLDSLIAAQEAYASSLEGVEGKEKDYAAALSQTNTLLQQRADDMMEDARTAFQLGQITHDDLMAAEQAHADALAAIPGKERQAAQARAQIAQERRQEEDEDAQRAREREEQRAQNTRQSLEAAAQFQREQNEDALHDATQAAQNEVDAARNALEEKKRLGTQTVDDEQRVTNAVVALVKAQNAAKVQAAQDALEKQRAAGGDTSEAERAVDNARKAAQQDLTRATAQEARRRSDDEQAALDKTLDRAMKNIDAAKAAGEISTQEAIARLQALKAAHPDMSEDKRTDVDASIDGKKKELNQKELGYEKALGEAVTARHERELREMDELEARGAVTYQQEVSFEARRRQLISERYQGQRDEINRIADAEKDKSAASEALRQEKLKAVNAQEQDDLQKLATKHLGYLQQVLDKIDAIDQKQQSGSAFNGPQSMQDAFKDFGLGKGGIFNADADKQKRDALKKAGLSPDTDIDQLRRDAKAEKTQQDALTQQQVADATTGQDATPFAGGGVGVDGGPALPSRRPAAAQGGGADMRGVEKLLQKIVDHLDNSKNSRTSSISKDRQSIESVWS